MELLKVKDELSDEEFAHSTHGNYDTMILEQEYVYTLRHPLHHFADFELTHSKGITSIASKPLTFGREIAQSRVKASVWTIHVVVKVFILWNNHGIDDMCNSDQASKIRA